MKIRPVHIILLLLILTVPALSAKIPMGSWRTHLAYNNIVNIAQTPDKVYGISQDGAMFSVGKHDDNVEIYSKIYGLNDNNVSYINYSNGNGVLVVAYSNSNIDLITDDNEIINIPDIYSSNSINADKSINDICFNRETAYIGCGFGIVALDLNKCEVKDTYIIGDNGSFISVNAVRVHEDRIYALSGNLIYHAPLTGVNLLNYQNWERMSVPTTAQTVSMAIHEGMIYVTDTKHNLLKYSISDSEWSDSEKGIAYVNDNDGILWTIDSSGYITANIDGEKVTVHGFSPIKTAYDITRKTIWFSDTRGIMRYDMASQAYSPFKPSGPAVNYAWRIKNYHDRMYVVPGGRWASQYSRQAYAMIFDSNDTWINIDYSTIVATTGSEALDFVDIIATPEDKRHFFAASYGFGLFEFQDDMPLRVYNAGNSGVESIYPNGTADQFARYQRTDGLTYDEEGNLWFLNMGTPSVVKYLKDGVVNGLQYTNLSNMGTIQDILIDSRNPNIKYVVILRVTGSGTTSLFVIDDNGTKYDESDDRTRMFSSFIDQDGNPFKPSVLRCIAQDNDGTIWIGTDSGPILLGSGYGVFDDDFTITRVKIPRNDGTNAADFLLDNTQVNAISVDGGNRKWIGTETAGVFLMSPDGETTLEHFTTDNSPLLSDNIICLDINDITGEVFFGTGNGIISYQSDASEGGEDFSDVHAYPNPVREDYHGLITITGLMKDTRVRITDVSGSVVYETVSNGGVATWDGTRPDGQRVATGVYIAMCISDNGKKHAMTKILVIN